MYARLGVTLLLALVVSAARGDSGGDPAAWIDEVACGTGSRLVRVMQPTTSGDVRCDSILTHEDAPAVWLGHDPSDPGTRLVAAAQAGGSTWAVTRSDWRYTVRRWAAGDPGQPPALDTVRQDPQDSYLATGLRIETAGANTLDLVWRTRALDTGPGPARRSERQRLVYAEGQIRREPGRPVEEAVPPATADSDDDGPTRVTAIDAEPGGRLLVLGRALQKRGFGGVVPDFREDWLWAPGYPQGPMVSLTSPTGPTWLASRRQVLAATVSGTRLWVALKEGPWLYVRAFDTDAPGLVQEFQVEKDRGRSVFGGLVDATADAVTVELLDWPKTGNEPTRVLRQLTLSPSPQP